MGCILTFTIKASNRIGWVKINGRDYLDGNLGNSPFLYVCYVKSVKLIPTPKIIFYVAHA